MNEKESILEKIRRQDYKMDKNILESHDFQNEINKVLRMQNVPLQDIEIDKQR